VHQGGGRFLLEALLGAFHDKDEFVLFLDDRMSAPKNMAHNIQIKRVRPSVLQRLDSERWLARLVAPEDIVLCFGNLPPLFKLRARVVIFVQNRYLINQKKLEGFSFKTRLRIKIERLWLSKMAHHVDEFIVQTPSMKSDLLSAGFVTNQPVYIRPFANILGEYKRTISDEKTSQEYKEHDFVYVASGDPHKNHKRLIEAWCLLAQQEIFPSLCLTLDEKIFADLWNWINKQKLEFGLKLENRGSISHSQVLQLYMQAGALIYPSTFESFGLPLIEARQAELPVLASELDYVRDVLDPEETFDPESAVSIAKAVKRFMGLEEKALSVLSAENFLQKLLEKCDS
jgi:glycosyltransferase involved in cell wall biosynthesis